MHIGVKQCKLTIVHWSLIWTIKNPLLTLDFYVSFAHPRLGISRPHFMCDLSISIFFRFWAEDEDVCP